MGQFSLLSNKISKSYKKKGMSAKKAKSIGNAVAAKIGRKKFGTKKFAKMSVIGRKRK